MVESTSSPVSSSVSSVMTPIQNNDQSFLGFDNFKDWFDSWLDTMYGPNGAMTPVAGQVDIGRDLSLMAENKKYNPNDSEKTDSEMYNQIYDWIYDIINKSKSENESNWWRQAKWNYDRYLEEVKRVESREDTAYQRAVDDLKKAGINPLLAFSSLSGAGSSSVSPSDSSYINNNSLNSGLLNSILQDKKIGLALMQLFTGIISKIIPGLNLVKFFK